MQRKVKKTLTFLMALVMVMSLICGSGFSAIAEETGLTEPVTDISTEAETVPQSDVYEMETPAGIQEEPAEVPVTEPASEENVTNEGTVPSETLTEAVSENGTELPENNVPSENVTEAVSESGTTSEAVSEMSSETDSENVTEAETSEKESETEKAAKEEKPEFTYSMTVDGISVSIHAPAGILPAGTTVTVKPLAADVLDTAEQTINNTLGEKEVVQLIGFDITFFDADGNEMHDLDGAVRIEYSGMNIVDEAEEARVYHADENGNITNALTEAAAPAGTVGFTSDQFSPVLYAVTARAESHYMSVLARTIQNAQVIYVTYSSESDIDDLEFKEIREGGKIETGYFSDRDAHYVLCFVKPDDNYLLTGLGAYGNNDIYSVDGPYGNIANYPGIGELASRAKAEGYVGVFGWMRRGGNLDGNFEVVCQSPDITVGAVSDKAENVIPGDKLTFTVTITPGTTESGKDKVSGVEINTITVNGQSVKYGDIVLNTDGTYTTTVEYTATAEDCASGSVKLDVTASVSYDVVLWVSDGQTISSTATITKSAATTCYIAPKNQVTYTHTYDIPKGTEITKYPDEIAGNPVDSKKYYQGETVYVTDKIKDGDTVQDDVNGGTWTFDGWYLDENKVTEATMTENGLTFTGIWKFTPKDCEVTIKKIVAGGMGDRNKKFDFAVSAERAGENVDLGNEASFALSHGESKAITLKAGTKLTISETAASGYVSTIQTIVNEEAKPQKEGNTITVTVTDDMEIVFTNTKDYVPDTGITLDSLPYILILAVVIAGAVLFVIDRRRKYRA